jgi:hypothetical protein
MLLLLLVVVVVVVAAAVVAVAAAAAAAAVVVVVVVVVVVDHYYCWFQTLFSRLCGKCSILSPTTLHNFFSFLRWGESIHLVRRPLFGLLYQSRMIDDDECGAVGEMRIGRGKRSTRRKPAPVLLCPPQITHDLTKARTRAAAVGSRRLTA